MKEHSRSSFSQPKHHKIEKLSNTLTPVQRSHVASVTKATKRLTLKDLGIDEGCNNSIVEKSKNLLGILRYINMHNDRYNATDKTNVMSHLDVLDTENFLPKPSIKHFQQFEEKENHNDSNANDERINVNCVDCSGITELALENWECISLLTLRPIALFLGANITAVSFAKCFNLTDEMINVFIANTASLQKIDLSECIQLTDLSIRFAVQCCGMTLQGINLSKCSLLTNDACRWIGGRYSFNLAKEGWKSTRTQKKSTHRSFYSSGCENLKHLNLSGCNKIDDDGLRHIGWGCCRKLSHLNLSECCRITDKGLIDALLTTPLHLNSVPLCHKMQVLILEGCELVTHQGLLPIIHVKNNDKISNEYRVAEANTFFGFYSPLPQRSSKNRPSSECEINRNHDAMKYLQRIIKSRYKDSFAASVRLDSRAIKAASFIQRGFKYAMRKKVWIRKEQSASSIKNLCRRCLSKLLIDRMKKEEATFQARLKASIKIQAYIRLGLVMKEWTVVQDLVKQVRQNILQQRFRTGAMKLQALIRHCNARTHINSVRLQRRTEKMSAVVLQCFYRQLQSFNRSLYLSHELEVLNYCRQQASIRVQSFTRSKVTLPKVFLNAKRSCLLLQSRYRAHVIRKSVQSLARRKYISQTFSAIQIQRCFRGRQITHWKDIRVHMMASRVQENQSLEIKECQQRAFQRHTELLACLHENGVQSIECELRDPAVDAVISIQRIFRGKQVMSWQEIRHHITAARVTKRQTDEMKESRRRALQRCEKLWCEPAEMTH